MHCKIPVIDNTCKWHWVKSLHRCSVNFFVELVDSLFSERKVLGHVSSLVVASEEQHALRMSHFQRKEQDHSLNGKHASVYVVSEKQVVDLLGTACLLEEMQEVIILAMDVSNYSNIFSVFSNFRLIIFKILVPYLFEFNILSLIQSYPFKYLFISLCNHTLSIIYVSLFSYFHYFLLTSLYFKSNLITLFFSSTSLNL